MRPDEMLRRGVALAERVRREVDTTLRLDLMLQRRRRSRVAVIAAAAVAVGVLIVGSLWLTAAEDAPVVTEPPTTLPRTTVDLQSLPVEAYMVLLSDFTVEAGTGVCEGSGPLAGVRAGSGVEVIDTAAGETDSVIALPAGEEVTSADERAAFLLPDGVTAACVFTLPDLGYDTDEYADVTLLPESDPDIATGATIRGRRVVFRFGDIPGDAGLEPAPGVVSDDPAIWQTELTTLRDSAGPGRIVGFINLAAPHSSGAPTSPDQPVCVGIGPFRDIVPGAPVVLGDGDGNTLAETMLRGAAFDGPIGCSLWFGVDVASEPSVYLIGLGDHPPVTFGHAELEAVSWQLNIWSSADHMRTNCVEVADESQPMTCVVLEPLG